MTKKVVICNPLCHNLEKCLVLEKAMTMKKQLMILFRFLNQNDIAIQQSDKSFNPKSFLKALLVIKCYNNTINIYN